MLAVSTEASSRVLRNPLDVLRCGWRDRRLILRLAGREVAARYRGSLLGWFWALLVPLLNLAVFTFVFSVVFPGRWGFEVENTGQFALVLFSGMIVFNIFNECFTRAPRLLLENVSYIKKVVFPLECLAWVSLLVALFNALVASAAFVLGYVLLLGAPPLSALLWPLVLAPLLLLTLGLVWFLSALGVYVRDVAQFIPVLTTVLFYLTPILFPLERLRDAVHPTVYAALALNPLAVAVESSRCVLFGGAAPDWPTLAGHTLAAWAIAWLGYMWFAKTRKGFADVC